MIQIRYHNLISRLPGATQRSGNMKCDRGHVITERYLLRSGIEEVCECRARVRQCCVCLGACRVVPMCIRVMIEEVVSDGFYNLSRCLRSTWPVKVGDGFSCVRTFERRKIGAN